MSKAEFSAANEGRLWRGEEADRFPVLDLLQADTASQAPLQVINAQRRAFAALCGNCLSQLFSGQACSLRLTPFVVSELPVEQDEASLWLLARADADAQAAQCALMQMASETLFQLAVLFFGGRPQSPARDVTRRQPTDTEVRLLQRLLQHQLDILSPLLDDAPAHWEVAGALAEQLPDSGRWLCSQVALQVGEHTIEWQLYWPLSTDSGERPVTDLDGALQQALHQVPVRLQVIMQRWQLNLADVSQWQAGDLLPLQLGEPLPACLGAQVCLHGHIAEHQGQLVFQVADVKE